ncbi:putative membrane-bound O-acyltransferase C24H6.01c [Phalaenopsis equestris]|uniref:putative membrane-bound O-acyltransferase C24H6.01c n=1 Tax=Phalaenopsis equestris TaxID=78828 RepID=UPI0009E26F41|nr:putative membrane-bound O-acyltransferase C24H6.01c [Phalaenopsis equestris]
MGPLLWKRSELFFLILYAVTFYVIVIQRTLYLSHDHSRELYSLRRGWMFNRLNDLSDAQWRNFHGNLPILTFVFGIFTFGAIALRNQFNLKGRGMSVVWFIMSLAYILHLHGACVVFVLSIASVNFFLAKILAKSKFYLYVLWFFNISVLLLNRIYEGYSFSSFGNQWAFLDNYRGSFRWQICFNLVVLRMLSFGCDYHWSLKETQFDQKKHIIHCSICSSGNSCYHLLQEKRLHFCQYSFIKYLAYLIYAPLYIAGPIVSFNAFASQLDAPKKRYSVVNVIFYGSRWVLCFGLMETMTHFLYYNAFANSGLWRQFSPLEIFIIGYGVINFIWLKFLLIWRYFRFWSLVAGIETIENMPMCLNNCYSLETFWKSWHASFNKWIVRYMYIPLGGSQKKLFNMWIIFTFVALWHDIEWKLLLWAWLTCIFFIPELVIKSSISSFTPRSAAGKFVLREMSAVAGAVTITCLMVANLVGYVVGPSGTSLLISRLFRRDGFPVLVFIFLSFYVAVKLMFHIRDIKQNTK